jgi:hypothetical protein
MRPCNKNRFLSLGPHRRDHKHYRKADSGHGGQPFCKTIESAQFAVRLAEYGKFGDENRFA